MGCCCSRLTLAASLSWRRVFFQSRRSTSSGFSQASGVHGTVGPPPDSRYITRVHLKLDITPLATGHCKPIDRLADTIASTCVRLFLASERPGPQSQQSD